MKKEIMTLIIGILIGAVVTTIVFMVVKPNDRRDRPEIGDFKKFGNYIKWDENGTWEGNGTRPEKPDGKRRPNRRSSDNDVKDELNEE